MNNISFVKKYIVVYVVLFLVCFFITGCGTEKMKKEKQIQFIQVKSEDMINDYIRDQGTAENKYKNKNIKLTGNVLHKGQFKNGNNFFVVTNNKYAAGRNYAILIEYPVDRVDDVNKLKYGDFLVAEGVCVGIVPQDNPTDVSIQVQVGRKIIADDKKNENIAKSDEIIVSESTNSSNKNNKNEIAKNYNNSLIEFENRLSNFASKINSESENKAALKATGTILKEDIENIKGKVQKNTGSDVADQIIVLLNIQERRTDCMLRGINGDSNAFAEGGGYYDEFQIKYKKLKQDNAL